MSKSGFYLSRDVAAALGKTTNWLHQFSYAFFPLKNGGVPSDFYVGRGNSKLWDLDLVVSAAAVSKLENLGFSMSAACRIVFDGRLEASERFHCTSGPGYTANCTLFVPFCEIEDELRRLLEGKEVVSVGLAVPA